MGITVKADLMTIGRNFLYQAGLIFSQFAQHEYRRSNIPLIEKGHEFMHDGRKTLRV